MSGPKTSRYTLTNEQRQILAEQRRIERLRIQEHTKMQIYRKELLLLEGHFSDAIKKAIEIEKRIGDDSGLLKQTERLTKTINKLQCDISFDQDTSLDELHHLGAETDEAMSQVRKLVSDIEKLAAINEESLIYDIQEKLDKGFSTSFAELTFTVAQDENNLSNTIRSALTSLQHEIILSSVLAAKVSETLNKLDEINNIAFLENFNALTCIPLQKKCKSYIDEYHQCYVEFEKLRSDYVVLCTMQNIYPEDTECSADGIVVLKSKIEEIEAVIAFDDEKVYVSSCIDEVMNDIGYSILGSRNVTKKSGTHFRSELYNLEDGTAVNITYSSDGRITMELGGLDNTDRIPDDIESQQLCIAMETFCDDFNVIEEKLASKGVIVKDRISILPPNLENAQIINMSDYEMKTVADKFVVQNEKRNQLGRKVIRKD